LLAERAPHIASGQTLHLGVKPERLLLFAADGKRLRPRDQAASTVVQMKERLQ
jgi:multiple sugar transport system ATP-binding protein